MSSAWLLESTKTHEWKVQRFDTVLKRGNQGPARGPGSHPGCLPERSTNHTVVVDPILYYFVLGHQISALELFSFFHENCKILVSLGTPYCQLLPDPSWKPKVLCLLTGTQFLCHRRFSASAKVPFLMDARTDKVFRVLPTQGPPAGAIIMQWVAHRCYQGYST